MGCAGTTTWPFPKGSTERIDAAHQLIDYWYNLDAATLLSEYIGYFTGVAGVQDRIEQDAQAARDAGDTETADQLEILAPQVEPTEDQLANTYPDKQLTEEEEAEWNNLFEEVLGRLTMPLVEAEPMHARRWVPYALLGPGALWLLLFFAIPMGYMFIVSLQEGSLGAGYELTWNFAIYPEVIGRVRRDLPPLRGLRAADHPDHVPHRLPDGLLHRLPRWPVQERSCS